MKKIIVLICLLFTTLLSNSQCVRTLAGKEIGGDIGNTTGIVIDSLGNSYATTNSVIVKITPSGLVSNFAGILSGFVDGPISIAKFNSLGGIAVDKLGNFYVTDRHSVRKISTNGIVTTLAGAEVYGFTDGTGKIARFKFLNGIVIDSQSNIYVVDAGNNCIRKITPEGVVSTFAGSGSAGFKDGQGINASFNLPRQITIDKSGNLYVTDQLNFRIRKITPSGFVSTYAGTGVGGIANGNIVKAQFHQPEGITIDSLNNFYICEKYHHIVRKISSNGDVSTLAGSTQGNVDGIGINSKFNTPYAIATDLTGNVYVSHWYNVIRKIYLNSVNINYSGSPFCKSNTIGQSVILSGTGSYKGGSFTSSPSGLSINSLNGAITPSSSSAGTYSITYTTPIVSGCPTATVTKQITITSSPTASINYTGVPFCKSLTTIQPVSLSGTGAYTGGYFSSTTGLSINSSTGSINPSLSTAGNYNITYNTPAGGGCASISSSRQVSITAIPTASIIYSGSPFCKSLYSTQPVILTGSGAYLGGTYSCSTVGLSINSSTGVITPSYSNPGTYVVTYNTPASGGCSSISTSTNLVVLPLNTVSDGSSKPKVCINNPITNITHTTTGATGIGVAIGLPSGISAVWKSNIITISGTPLVSGTFNYEIPLTGGCGTDAAFGTITILPNLNSNITADGITSTNLTINSGNIVQLQLNGSFGTPANIQWTPNIGISSTSITNPLVYPTTTTTYTASFLNTNGCQQSSSITVNVNPLSNIGSLSISSPNTSVGIFDTITVNVQLNNAKDVYSLYMKLKGNSDVNQYLSYLGHTAGTLLGSSVISTPPTVTNGVPDFGMTKVGAVPGYTGSGLFYSFRFVPKNTIIPSGTSFCFYLDDVNAYNSAASTCGITNQGQFCLNFTNQVKVWPGDLNNSKMVTTADLLPIGYFYNSTGQARTNATIQWTEQPATLWGYNHSSKNGDAYKVFADSNGDGIINNADQAAIGYNLNKKRKAMDKPFGINPPIAHKKSRTVGVLNVTPNNTIINPKSLPQTITFNISLTNTGSLNSLYGISVNLIFNDTIFDLSTATIDYTGSIFGNIGTDCLAMNFNSSNGISVGLTRYANASIYGEGLLFKITIQTKTTLPNLTQTKVMAYVDAANNQLGDELSIQDAPITNLTINNANNNNNSLSIDELIFEDISLYPNPTNDIIHLVFKNKDSEINNLKLKVFNSVGQLVDEKNIQNNTIDISTKNWGENGVYFVQLVNSKEQITETKKVIIQK